MAAAIVVRKLCDVAYIYVQFGDGDMKRENRGESSLFGSKDLPKSSMFLFIGFFMFLGLSVFVVLAIA